jgi:6,7-dimethyl-8-ribityllumazine synthase
MTLQFNPSASAESKMGDANLIAIVVSRYNDHITNSLCDAAVATLLAHGIRDNEIVVLRVPGAWDLVYASKQMISLDNCRGVIALGAVIKGETTHDQHINRAVSMGLMQLSIDTKKPV